MGRPFSLRGNRDYTRGDNALFVMPGLVPGIHVLRPFKAVRREWPGQARP